MLGMLECHLDGWILAQHWGEEMIPIQYLVAKSVDFSCSKVIIDLSNSSFYLGHLRLTVVLGLLSSEGTRSANPSPKTVLFN